MFVAYRIFCWVCYFCIDSVEPTKKDEIYYCCYKKKKNIGMLFRSMCGLPVCSSAIIVNNHIYRLKKKEEYMQKETFTLNYIKQKYLVLDTGYSINDINNWNKTEKELLNQKRLEKDKLFKGFNCLKNCSVVLNQLKGFEVPSWLRFTSVYSLILFFRNKWGIKNGRKRNKSY